MKKIEIQQFREPKARVLYANDKMYEVYLGNQTRNYFTSKRDCLAFLAKTNKMLNDNMFFLNDIFADVFRESREIWGFSDKYFNEQQNINGYFTQITNAFERVSSLKSHINENTMVWNQLLNIIELLKKCCQIFSNIYTERNFYNKKRRVDTIIKQLQHTFFILENFGNKEKESEYYELFE